MLVLIALGCASEPPPLAPFVTFQFESMHTRIDVVLRDEPGAEEAVQAVQAVFADVEETANEWRPGSPLAEVNRRAGEAVPIDRELHDLLARSLEIAELSGGAFDPTWAAVWDLWDFKAVDPRPPSEAAVAERLPRIGWERVHLEEESVRLEPGTVLGVGGIAKGWALDRSAAALRERGFADFSLSAGGQVMSGGTKDGRAWRVGLRDPRGSRDDSFALIDVSDASVSTSGDYERFFEADGVRYHHILDPRTGFPARGVRSATVVCEEGALADGLSTALVVLGVTEGLALASRLGVGAVLVDDAGLVHATPELALTSVHPPRP
jgi:thiamine biosynthesis lipoprotein